MSDERQMAKDLRRIAMNVQVKVPTDSLPYEPSERAVFQRGVKTASRKIAKQITAYFAELQKVRERP